MNKLIFDKRMMGQFLRGKRNVIYPYNEIKYLPQNGELMFIAEPFVRQYADQNGMHIESSVIYQDDTRKVFAENCEEIPFYWGRKCFSAPAMLEYESRYFIRVNCVRTRLFSSLKMSETIHENIYEYERKNIKRFHHISFEVVPYEVIEEWYKAIRAEEFFNDWL